MMNIFVALWQRWLCLIVPMRKRFINRTGLPDSVLEQMWKDAQERVATQENFMNPIELIAYPDRKKIVAPPLPAARSISPRNVYVTALPDVPVAQLVKMDAKWGTHKDPTGIILANNQYLATCVSFVRLFIRPRIFVAKSQEAGGALGWEFENVILNKLGQDMHGR